MDILHICSYYIGSWAYRGLIKGIGKTVKTNTVYVYTDNKSNSEYLNDENIVVSRCYPSISRYLFYWKHMLVVKDLSRKINLADYHLIHAHSLFSNGYIAYKAKLKYGIPYIVNVSNTDLNYFFKRLPFLRPLGNKILDYAYKIVFISNPYLEKTINDYVYNKEEIRSKSYVIPYCIDDFWIENTKIKYNFVLQEELRLIFIGQVDKNKNTETIIKACKLLIQRGFNVKFTIVGRIDKGMQQDGSDFVHYIPHSSKEELMILLRQSDIFIMPSRNETFGLVYPEAMSQGVPVIYTRGQGFDEHYADGEVGYSVDCNDPAEIADKVELIVSDYERISRACVARISDFRMENIARRYKNIYNNSDD